jgi:Uma2 family endonuclease
MPTAERLYTAEEFYRLPDPIDGGKTELVCGHVVTMSPVGRPHSLTVRAIEHALAPFVELHQLGELHIELGFALQRLPDIVRAPDVAFIDQAALVAAGEWDAFFEGSPTLAIEVWSPEDRRSEVDKKIGEYLHAGARRVWDVHPQRRTVTVHRPDGTTTAIGENQELTSDDAGFVVPGLLVRVRDLFPR